MFMHGNALYEAGNDLIMLTSGSKYSVLKGMLLTICIHTF